MKRTMLTDQVIRSEASGGNAYARGCNYYRSGRVRTWQYDAAAVSFKAIVQGEESYRVRLDFDPGGEVLDFSCTCPAFANCAGACKHVVAVMKMAQERWAQYFGAAGGDESQTEPGRRAEWDLMPPSTRAMLDFFRRDAADEAAREMIRLIPTYVFDRACGRNVSRLEFSVGASRPYVVKDIRRFLRAVAERRELVFGKQFTFSPERQAFDPLSRRLLETIRAADDGERQLQNGRDGRAAAASAIFGELRAMRLNDSLLARFLATMDDAPFAARIEGEKIGAARVAAGRPPLALSVEASPGGIRLMPNGGRPLPVGLDDAGRYVYHQAVIYRVDEEFAKYAGPLLQCLADSRNRDGAFLPRGAAADFFSQALPALQRIGEIRVAAPLLEQFREEPLETRVYFDRCRGGIGARVVFKYGDWTIDPLAGAPRRPDGRVYIRRPAEERRTAALLEQFGFIREAERFVLTEEAGLYRFLRDGLPKLRDLAAVFYADGFKPARIAGGRISSGVRVDGGGMLEMTFHCEDFDAAELASLLAAYRLKKRYHRLKDGGFMPLDTPAFRAFAELADVLSLSGADLAAGAVKLPKCHGLYIDGVARRNGDFHLERSGAFIKMARDVKEPQDLEFPLPDGIRGRLRDYQKTGFKWLKALAGYGFGGILADDMGLGKTLQVIAFLLSEKEAAAAPSLAVVPTSLVYNWQEEARRFAPGLTVVTAAGPPEERRARLAALDGVDLVVTSYGLVKRDLEFYAARTFQYCILDEAQHIKNPGTQAAKAVKSIRAAGYFALTGTPIENSPAELWSIFDFLLPGYLGRKESFNKKYGTPILKNGDAAALAALSRRIEPFILRRMKKTVLKELPEKVESSLVNEMTPPQHKAYLAYLMKARRDFERLTARDGIGRNQIAILALLTRLRQLCCHPALVFENYRGGSGKMNLLMEVLQDALRGGRRILLFSQFTGMLGLIKAELDKAKINYQYLDGATKADERLRLARDFNAGAGEVFLISLKAGGAGLNLTGADMVIHYDPWWNPAVEDQATDRAYRIGQQNSVQVYRLVAKHSVEEKIYEMQRRKRRMIDSLIRPGESLLTKMSEQEIRRLFEP